MNSFLNFDKRVKGKIGARFEHATYIMLAYPLTD